MIDELASLLGIPKEVLITLFVTLATMVVSISLTHLLAVRRERKAIATQERLKAYRVLHGLCVAITKRTELIRSESVNNLHLHLYTGAA